MYVKGKHAVQGIFVIKTVIVVFSNLLVLVNVVHVKPQLHLTHGDIKSKSTKILNVVHLHMDMTCSSLRITMTKLDFIFKSTEIVKFSTKESLFDLIK